MRTIGRILFFGCLLHASLASANENVLSIKSFIPTGAIQDVRQIVLEFDRPVARLGESVTAEHLKYIEIKPSLRCEWRWLDISRLACELPGDSAPPKATEYTVKILPGLKALDGAQLQNSVQYVFSTPPPAVNIRLYGYEKPGLPVFIITSDHRIIPDSLTRHLYFRDKNQRRYPVVLRSRKPDDEELAWRVSPAQEMGPGLNYSLVLEAGLKSHDGPLPGAEKVQGGFKTYPEFGVVGIRCAHADEIEMKPYQPDSSPPCLYNKVRIVFTDNVDTETVRKNLQVSPAIATELESTYSRSSAEVDLDRLLAPGRSQRLRLPAGAYIKDQFGRPLSKTFEMTVQTADLAGSIAPPKNTVLEQEQATDLPVVLANVKSATIEGKLYTSAGREKQTVFNTEFWRGTVDNRWHVVDTGMRKLFDRTSGYFTGTIAGAGKPVPVNVQITPFNIAAYTTASGYWIWVTRWADAEPVAGAEVRIYASASGQPLAQAREKFFKTDSSGLAFIPKRNIKVPPYENYRDAPKIIVEAVQGDDGGFLTTNAPWWGKPSEFMAWTSFSQPLYQPGDTVRFKVYARDLSADGYKMPAGDCRISIAYEGEDRSGYVPGFEGRKLAWSEFGAFSGEFELPKNATHGYYYVEIVCDGSDDEMYAGEFGIAEFNKQEFALTMSSDKSAVQAGEQVAVTVAARLQNGGAYAGAPVSLRAEVEAYSSLFEEDPALQHFYFQPGIANVEEEQLLFETSGGTDTRGDFSHRFKAQARGIYYGSIRLESSIKDARGKAIDERHTVDYFSVDRLVGIEQGYEAGADGSIDAHAIVIATADRQPLDSIPVTLRIERDTLNNVRQYYDQDKLSYRWNAVTSCRAQTTRQGIVCSFTPEASGYYRITAEIRDSRGRPHSSSWIEWIDAKRRNKQNLPVFELQAPEQAKVGENLEFSIESGADAATALVSLQRNDILQTAVHRLKKGKNNFSIPVTPAMAPGVYLMASIQKPRTGVPASVAWDDFDAGTPFLLHQHRMVKVADPRSEIGIGVQPDKQSYLPGDKVLLRLDARTAKPGEAVELSVAVVDQSLLQLYGKDAAQTYDVRTGFLSPFKSEFDFSSGRCSDLTGSLGPYGYRGPLDRNPDYDRGFSESMRFDCFNNLYSLQRTADMGVDEEVVVYGIRASLEDAVYIRRESSGVIANSVSADSIGATSPVKIRMDFRDLAFWLAAKTVTGGKPETIEFRLPDNLTRWRIFVLATGKDAQFGAASADISTEKMTEIRAALPSRLVENDELDARFTVFNRGAQGRHLDYSSTLEGALQADAGTKLQGGFDIASSDRAIVDLKAKATGAGKAKLSFLAGDEIDKDAVLATIPVVSGSLPEGAYMRGEISGLNTPQSPLSIPLQLPADAVPGSGRLALSFDSSRLDTIRGALEYGRDYPYTCWEQKLTRAVLAAMYLRAPEKIRAQLSWQATAALITETLEQAAGFQHDKGGMTFFGPQSGDPSRYLSAYTLVAFSWLREWGYKVPAEVEQQLQKYLAGKHEKKPQWEGDSINMALPLLLQRGLINPDAVEPVLPGSSVLEQVQHLALLPQLKPVDGYSSLLESLDRQAYRDQHAYSFPLASTTVAQCSLLSLLSNHPDYFKAQESRIEWLADSTRKLMQVKNHWRTTQENVFCAKALLDHDRYFHREPLDMKIAVKAGEFSGAVVLRQRGQKPETLELNPGKPGNSTEVVLSAAGRGKAYYTARLDYARDIGVTAAQNQGFNIRRSYKIKQGSNWVELKPDAVLQRGQLVRVDLTVWAPTGRNLVAVADPLPGNLEALNPAFATTSAPRDYISQEEGYSYADYVFYQRELGLQSVRFYAERVPAGEYQLSYTAQVIAAGKFTALPPLVEEMYAPEIYGRGAATVLLSK